uniref:hypothetical protein n=1 Tax=Bidens bipinnata TaxID=1527831 RepID=UPI001EE14B54|nr:hypothetical protein MFQ52_mgp55 [Bidens bipinnata]YP_010352690.1 hypothetical protein MFU86_mgp55 [Bidens biternata]UIR99352.1 hypothetical protein [Bidens alba var. radiata]UIR99044.1 hypothetical protein [Bidens bipinnata]UIR99107.1 hypothetical protein [Bidens biternata]UIR99169.1 hypothetical protein [Bidens biternata]UIR99288.1 hypothetical protein [Bidens bipinnata]
MISVKLDSLLKKEGVTNLQLIEENLLFRFYLLLTPIISLRLRTRRYRDRNSFPSVFYVAVPLLRFRGTDRLSNGNVYKEVAGSSQTEELSRVAVAEAELEERSSARILLTGGHGSYLLCY